MNDSDLTLGASTRALILVAAAINAPFEGDLPALMRATRDAGAPAEWLEELVLMAVLFAGFPKALVAAEALREVQPAPAEIGDAADYDAWRTWQQRGEAACERIYAGSYSSLRRNVRAMHPALDAWIVNDGYGRTISRPGLDLPRRELCAIAMLVQQGVPKQLHSHLRGALNVGATEQDIEQTLELVMRSIAGSENRLLVRLVVDPTWAKVRAARSRS